VYGFDWQGKHVTLVDTPGDPNFQADGQVALGALDAAVLVVSAGEGAKVGTERMWFAANDLGMPVVAFVNGMDRDRADSPRPCNRSRMGARPVALGLPRSAAARPSPSTCWGEGAPQSGAGEVPAGCDAAATRAASWWAVANATTCCSRSI
jgi:hypothetical protein